MPSGNEPRATRSDSTASASSATSGPPVSDRELPREMPLPPPFATKVPVPSWAGGSSKEQQQNARRKSSHVLFEGLTAQKRKGDPESVARRQSFNEQRPPPGFIGQMWNSWVRGDK
ncbi:hypothetical protein N657DRAFT_639084 [Parathielavia appendiculata]|uniref:Uncharacterized protein n=1 Tax=Parathielavia appendiculata TaxID=2587402 RepID=A0AAN6Z878_9PEZI|nr:hypothetical protein N657DRAFT_639084 [Parathielavia appendiculata]